MLGAVSIVNISLCYWWVTLCYSFLKIVNVLFFLVAWNLATMSFVVKNMLVIGAYNRHLNSYQGQSSARVWELNLFQSFCFAPHWLSLSKWIKILTGKESWWWSYWSWVISTFCTALVASSVCNLCHLHLQWYAPVNTF